MPVYAFLVALFAITFAGSPLVVDPFSGYSEDQLPIPQIEPPIQPAGWAFSIWGVIYAWLLVSAGFGLWKRAQDPAWNKVRPALIVSLFIGTFWLWIANQSPFWATVTIWLMLLSAVIALWHSPSQDRWLLRAPVGLYAGWLSAASVVSTATLLAGYGIVFGQFAWALIGIPFALVLALVIQARAPQAFTYGLAVTWALLGVVVANLGSETLVMALAAVAALVMAAATLMAARRSFA
ncbi:MAG: hypothetical protein ACU0CI_09895 [Shimia sp.]